MGYVFLRSSMKMVRMVLYTFEGIYVRIALSVFHVFVNSENLDLGLHCRPICLLGSRQERVMEKMRGLNESYCE